MIIAKSAQYVHKGFVYEFQLGDSLQEPKQPKITIQ